MSQLSKALESLTALNAQIAKAAKEKAEQPGGLTEEAVEKMANALIEKRLAAQKAEYDAKLADQSKGRKGQYEVMVDGDRPAPEKLFEKSDDSSVHEFRRWNDDVVLLSSLLKTHPRDLKTFQKGMAVTGISELKKAMDTATTNEGKEWVPTLFSSDLYDRVRLAANVFGLFKEIAMPSNPYKLPVVKADASAYIMSENTGDTPSKATASTPQSNNVTLTATKLATRVLFSEELREDSLIPVLDFIKNNIAIAMTYGLEDAIINGATGTHIDYDTDGGAAGLTAKAWNGLRKSRISANDVDINTLSTANLRSIRGKMGKYGAFPGKLAWIMSAKAYIKMLGLTEVLTREKYGDAATIVSGELAKFDGSPIVLSEKMRDDLASTGVNTMAGPNSFGAMILAYVPGFVVGTLRQLTVRSWFDVEADSTALINTWRGTFASWLDTTAEPIVGYGTHLVV